jgi:hypothetical protein
VSELKNPPKTDHIQIKAVAHQVLSYGTHIADQLLGLGSLVTLLTLISTHISDVSGGIMSSAHLRCLWRCTNMVTRVWVWVTHLKCLWRCTNIITRERVRVTHLRCLWRCINSITRERVRVTHLRCLWRCTNSITMERVRVTYLRCPWRCINTITMVGVTAHTAHTLHQLLALLTNYLHFSPIAQTAHQLLTQLTNCSNWVSHLRCLWRCADTCTGLGSLLDSQRETGDLPILRVLGYK